MFKGDGYLQRSTYSLVETFQEISEPNLLLICGAARLQRVTDPIKSYARHADLGAAGETLFLGVLGGRPALIRSKDLSQIRLPFRRLGRWRS